MLQLKDCSNDKQALWLVEDCYSLGSESDQDIQVQATAKAALIDVMVDKVFIEPFHAGVVQINGSAIAARHELMAGDELLVGRSKFVMLDPKREMPDKPDSSASASKPGAKTEVRQGLITQRFILTSQSNPTESYTLSYFTRVGRSTDCDIVVQSPKLSRHHAELMQDVDGITVVDLNSSNGTYINGKRVKRAALAPGDELSLAGSVYILSASEQASLQDEEQTTLRPAIRMEDLPVSPLASSEPSQAEADASLSLDATHMPENHAGFASDTGGSGLNGGLADGLTQTDTPSSRGASVAAISLVSLAVIAVIAYLVYAQWV